ncbi:uncharacterized protein LOC125540113 isoform X2 [Triticum urartu]|uniref:uncharacterized protein LOC125540113 isoform X2 n=1 Tax=Triticum urartu TaxID=4572 RepID=UPI002043270C|nr:uncharacterized protein LOC125540113 isoform X2 [Triticum urartu]
MGCVVMLEPTSRFVGIGFSICWNRQSHLLESMSRAYHFAATSRRDCWNRHPELLERASSSTTPMVTTTASAGSQRERGRCFNLRRGDYDEGRRRSSQPLSLRRAAAAPDAGEERIKEEEGGNDALEGLNHEGRNARIVWLSCVWSKFGPARRRLSVFVPEGQWRCSVYVQSACVEEVHTAMGHFDFTVTVSVHVVPPHSPVPPFPKDIYDVVMLGLRQV